MARRKFYEGEKVILGAWVELGQGEVLDVSGTDEFLVRVTEGIFSGSPVLNTLIWCKAESLRKDLEKKPKKKPLSPIKGKSAVGDDLEKPKKKRGRPRKLVPPTCGRLGEISPGI